MSDSTTDPARDDARLTVEDGGSTTDPGDLTAGEHPHGAAHAVRPGEDPVSGTTAPGTTATGTTTNGDGAADHDGLSSLDDDSIGHVFDQTNGVIEGADGDSDGTADSDVLSREERESMDQGLVRDDTAVTGEADDTRRTGA